MSRKNAPAESAAAVELRPLLTDLVALSLHAKQAHWNVSGPLFLPLHGQFDAMAAEYREWSDAVAERLRALGEPADGRIAALASSARAADLPAGPLPGDQAVSLLLGRIESLVAHARADLDRLGTTDPISQDLVIGIVAGLEKQAWMLRAQAS